MQTYKYLFLGFLILISLTSIFNRPGVGNFELFNNYQLKQEKSKVSQDLVSTLIKYPPGTYLILDLVRDNFELDPDLKLFNRQVAWNVFKVSLYISYILTWLALLYLAKSTKQKIKLPLLDTSIAYFASISILLSSVGLSFFDIYAAPLFILSIAFIFKKRFTVSSVFYLLALMFNWVLLVFSPLFLVSALKGQQNKLKGKVIQIIFFLITPILILITHILNMTTQTQFQYILNLHKTQKPDMVEVFLTLITGTMFMLSTVFLLKNIFNKTISRKLFLFISCLVVVLFFLIIFFWPNFLIWIFLGIFIFCYVQLVKVFIHRNIITNATFIKATLCIYLVFMLFIPAYSIGNLFWASLLSLVLYLVDNSNFTKLGLVLVNIIVFMNLYSSFGTSGIVHIRGTYFDFFGALFLSCLILFSSWYVVVLHKMSLHKISFRFLKQLNLQMTWFLVGFIALVILAFIPADGSSDHISWTQYAVASTTYPNPFRAYTEVILQYPPLSIVIISIFANAWKSIFGVSVDYTIAIKLSILALYAIFVGCLLKFKIQEVEKYNLSVLDKLVIILTTFSLIVQTQGLADINIYVIPSLFASIFFLFKKKYWLSGILMGLTLSIKWQPAITLPLFFITLIDFKEDIKVNIKRLFIFSSGFLIIPAISWSLVLIQPGGYFATARAFEFFATDNLLLSGQALNLNWVATYILHILNPATFGSLEQLDYLNRQIPTFSAPWILRGQFFLITSLAVIIYYWRFQKKEITSFLSAAIMIFFSHHQLNKSAYEKHLFYVVILMLFLTLVRPTQGNRRLLVLFDIMVIMNLVFFYGTAGTGPVDRLFFGFDITIIFSVYYFLIYLWVLWRYLKGGLLLERNSDRA